MKLLKGRNGQVGINIQPPPGPRPLPPAGHMNSLSNPLVRDLILMVIVRTSLGEAFPLAHSHGSHWVGHPTKAMTFVSPAYIILEGGSCLEMKFGGPATALDGDTFTLVLSK